MVLLYSWRPFGVQPFPSSVWKGRGEEFPRTEEAATAATATLEFVVCLNKIWHHPCLEGEARGTRNISPLLKAMPNYAAIETDVKRTTLTAGGEEAQ